MDVCLVVVYEYSSDPQHPPSPWPNQHGLLCQKSGWQRKERWQKTKVSRPLPVLVARGNCTAPCAYPHRLRYPTMTSWPRHLQASPEPHRPPSITTSNVDQHDIATDSVPPFDSSTSPVSFDQPPLDAANMAEFVRAQIFGTTFEITSRYDPTGHLPRTVDFTPAPPHTHPVARVAIPAHLGCVGAHHADCE